MIPWYFVSLFGILCFFVGYGFGRAHEKDAQEKRNL